MILIVGLGNPGRKFQKTRHNTGFRVVDKLKKLFDFSDWKESKKLLAKISKGKISGKKIILAKPQTFMNESGKSAKLLTAHYKLPTNQIWVVHDDLDILLGKMKISKKRGAAGHKGVRSIIDELGTPNKSLRDFTGQAKNFIRFRIGIQPKDGKPKKTAGFVLQKFNKDEEKIIKEIIKKTCQATEFAITKGIEKAMSEFNK